MTKTDLINLTKAFNELKIYTNCDKSLPGKDISKNLNIYNSLQKKILIQDKVLKNSLNSRSK